MSAALPTEYTIILGDEGLATRERIRVSRTGQTINGQFDLSADRWAIRRDGGMCLSRDREWLFEPSSSNREDSWLEANRWTLDEALSVAEEEAEKLRQKIQRYLDSQKKGLTKPLQF